MSEVKDFLYPFFKNSLTLEEFRIPGSLNRIDIICISKRIAIEVSPDKVHKEFNPFFHKNRIGYGKKIMADMEKANWCARNDLVLIELDDEDINNLSHKYIEIKFGVTL